MSNDVVNQFEGLVAKGKLGFASTLLNEQPFTSPPASWAKRNYFSLCLTKKFDPERVEAFYGVLIAKGFADLNPAHVVEALKKVFKNLAHTQRLAERLVPALLPYVNTISPDDAVLLLSNTAIHTPSLCQSLVDAGLPIDSMDKACWGALRHVAATNKGHAATALLLQLGANPNGPNGSRSAPLLHAGHPRVAYLLLDQGADPNIANASMETPLIAWAQEMQMSFGEDWAACKDVLRYIARKGGDPYQVSIHNETAAEILQGLGEVALAQELVAYYDACTMSAQTPSPAPAPRTRL